MHGRRTIGQDAGCETFNSKNDKSSRLQTLQFTPSAPRLEMGIEPFLTPFEKQELKITDFAVHTKEPHDDWGWEFDRAFLSFDNGCDDFQSPYTYSNARKKM